MPALLPMLLRMLAFGAGTHMAGKALGMMPQTGLLGKVAKGAGFPFPFLGPVGPLVGGFAADALAGSLLDDPIPQGNEVSAEMVRNQMMAPPPPSENDMNLLQLLLREGDYES